MQYNPIDDDAVAENVSRKLMQLRSTMGWTQGQMGQKIQVTGAYVSQVEKKYIKFPSLASLVKFSQLPGITFTIRIAGGKIDIE